MLNFHVPANIAEKINIFSAEPALNSVFSKYGRCFSSHLNMYDMDKLVLLVSSSLFVYRNRACCHILLARLLLRTDVGILACFPRNNHRPFFLSLLRQSRLFLTSFVRDLLLSPSSRLLFSFMLTSSRLHAYASLPSLHTSYLTVRKLNHTSLL